MTLGRRFALPFLCLLAVARAVTIDVSGTPSHNIPSTLWGMMYEDISSGDGGLYAELLQNRAFQKVTPGTSAALNAWSAINGAAISVIAESTPVSSALPNALHLTIPSGSTGQVGFANGGFYGIKVTAGTTYTGSFFYRFPASSTFRGNAQVQLQTTAGAVLGSTTVALSGAQTAWQQVNFTIVSNQTPGALTNRFAVTVDGAAASGQNVNFAMFSLFPPTFKNRPNGMRQDIAQALADAKPAFWRFPGGNNLEGQTAATRWVWNATLGPLSSRPGRQGDWGYVNTDGLGLLEYLEWCEDLNMIPIMGVWAGYALGGTSVAENQLQPFIQEAIDQINFVIGDPKTNAAAKKRADLGRTAPFALEYIEIGNEDFIGQAPSTYTYRWKNFVGNLTATFPQLKFIATSNVLNTGAGSPALTPSPKFYDVHVYQTPTWFSQNAFFYDNFTRNGMRYFEGEYAAISTNSSNIFGNPSTGRLTYPTMQSAAGEAAFMTGLERNSDIVFAAAYAPLLGHISGSQWTPNLVGFDSGSVFLSTSYYVQKFFAQDHGDQYLPSTLPTRNGTLFWSVTRTNSPATVIVKVANTVGTAASLTFNFPFNVASTGSLQLLTGAGTTSNTPSSTNAIVPTTSSISTGRTTNYNAPGFSVSVIKIALT